MLTPGRYVGTEEAEADGEPFPEKMKRLVGELQGQLAEASRLGETISCSLKEIGYDQ